jgi:ubiquinone/menaquinone biosynthesis C-methylase UbiE
VVIQMKKENIDLTVVEDFGREWERFDQTGTDQGELEAQFQRYFSVFPWDRLASGAEGFDLGCGSGRWAAFAAARVGRLHCIDASASALGVAKRNLARLANCSFHHASVHEIPLVDASMDFGYSLGVLHHIPDTVEGLRSCARKLKPGAPFLVYLYYALDNRPAWYRWLWKATDVVRRGISASPAWLKTAVCDAIAALVYFPLARTSAVLERMGASVHGMPLSSYRMMSFYTMRTDALDRFGTRLEQRFTRRQIEDMLHEAGFEAVRFSAEQPFWCAVAYRT